VDQRSFPKQAHLDFVDHIAREEVSKYPELTYVDTLASSAVTRRTYDVGVERAGQILRLPIPFQVIERCEHAGNDEELRQRLKEFLESSLKAELR